MNHHIGRRALIATAGAAMLAPGLAAAAQRPKAPLRKDTPVMPRAPQGDGPGFKSIFDGQSLAGWAGDPRYWRVEEGAIVGEITPATLLRSNTFLAWQGGEVQDFELKAQYRISKAGNSGINYRSILVEDEVTPANRFAMSGLQFDIDGANLFTAMVYEERGRSFLARRGQFSRVDAEPAQVIGSIGEAAALKQAITADWNEAHIIAKGPALYHLLNGQLMAAAIDESAKRRTKGLIGVQVHVGPPMKVEYRNIRLKRL